MAAAEILILGCGYTGRRVAASMKKAGYRVACSSRHPERLAGMGGEVFAFDSSHPESYSGVKAFVGPETRVLHSVPGGATEDCTAEFLPYLRDAQRIIYLSTTGVYGRQVKVAERTAIAPETDRERGRAETERLVLEFGNSLVLRPAAIYGPHRGVHSAIAAGTFRLAGDGSRHVSRIHVDDLAAHCVAGLLSDLQGAWPVADDEPCPSAEIAEFCAALLNVPIPSSVPQDALSETRRANRRVDGSAVRLALGVELLYPSYRDGIPASMAAEALERAS